MTSNVAKWQVITGFKVVSQIKENVGLIPVEQQIFVSPFTNNWYKLKHVYLLNMTFILIRNIVRLNKTKLAATDIKRSQWEMCIF